jgi:hypothetical protein
MKKNTIITLTKFLFILSSQAFAQGTIGIGTTNPISGLDATFGDSGFVALGQFGQGPSINLNTEGPRLFWYPRKAAFRAGLLMTGSWTNQNIGNYSIALGRGPIARGESAFATGFLTQANGTLSTAMGQFSEANGLRSFALGSSVKANNQDAMAIGLLTQANGFVSFATGVETRASGDQASAFGTGTVARAFGSMAIGRFNDSISTASTSTWVENDPLFIAGNGANNTNRSNAFTLYKSGALTLGGKLASGNPYSGNLDGVSMQWLPLKAAFRAGQVTGTEWSDVEVGYYSVAFGRNTKASGLCAVALGDGSVASGFYSFSAGLFAEASGTESTAFGTNSKATAANSFAVRGEASGSNAIAFGGTASGPDAFTRNGTASGSFSNAIGFGTQSKGIGAVAIGWEAIAEGNESIALGRQSKSNGSGSITLGEINEANGLRSIAMGYFSKANNQDAIAMGNQVQANGFVSIATGVETRASGDQASTFGYGTVARAYRSMAIGSFNDSIASSNPSMIVATDPAFIVGNGTNNTTRSNALTLFKNGNMIISGTLTQSSDARLKKDIEPINDAVQKLEKLSGYHYHWKNEVENPGLQTGLLAQEVKEVFPELVVENHKGEMSVNYSGMIPYLLEAVKSQQQTIEQLKQEIKALKKRKN